MSNAKKEEESSFYEEDKDQPVPPENVVAYNELRSCADLQRMHTTGKLELQPDFQREVVWKRDEQSRFIDSLVKQLPIPSMCFSLDHGTQRWKVIDGLQRMSTITAFLGSNTWQLQNLQDIHPLLRGRKNVDLREGSDDERRVYASVEDISVPITVIRCSYASESHMRYLFTIFNRLNSGGVRLNNQEIRNCIYSGLYNDTLKHFDRTNTNWKLVCHRIWGKLDRFRSVEILLRAQAFTAKLAEYNGNLAGFLNSFMLSESKKNYEECQIIQSRLEKMAGLAALAMLKLGTGKRSLTFVEGVLVGILSNLDAAPDPQSVEATNWVGMRVELLKALPEFGDGARYALASVNTVRARLSKATTAFA